MQKLNICALPEYRSMVDAYNRAFEIHGECSITRDMRAAVTFLCNYHQMSFRAMAEGDVNNGKKDQLFDVRFTDKPGTLQTITNKVYMS
jgi:hypothetical protein